MSALPRYIRHQLVLPLPKHHPLRCRDIWPAFDLGVAEQRLYGSSQGNDLKTTDPEVCYLVIFAACYFDFAAGYFVRWPASNSASAMTSYRGD
jgi:hypothetical protein